MRSMACWSNIGMALIRLYNMITGCKLSILYLGQA